MPASRRKAATTRLPRSWPSRPILVMRMRAGGSIPGDDIRHSGWGRDYGRTRYAAPWPRQCEEANRLDEIGQKRLGRHRRQPATPRGRDAEGKGFAGETGLNASIDQGRIGWWHAPR